MKHFSASNPNNYPIKVWEIPLSVQQSTRRRMVTARQRFMWASMDILGLVHPIPFIGVVEPMVGGCRLQYAVNNGYTHIDVTVCKSHAEMRKIMAEQRKWDIGTGHEEMIYRER